MVGGFEGNEVLIVSISCGFLFSDTFFLFSYLFARAYISHFSYSQLLCK